MSKHIKLVNLTLQNYKNHLVSEITSIVKRIGGNIETSDIHVDVINTDGYAVDIEVKGLTLKSVIDIKNGNQFDQLLIVGWVDSDETNVVKVTVNSLSTEYIISLSEISEIKSKILEFDSEDIVLDSDLLEVARLLATKEMWETNAIEHGDHTEIPCLVDYDEDMDCIKFKDEHQVEFYELYNKYCTYLKNIVFNILTK